MMRCFGLAVIILGLIIQPSMAAMPIQIIDSSIHKQMVSDSTLSVHNDDASMTGCHETAPFKATVDSLAEHCDNCSIDDCNYSGLCTSSCMIGWLAVVQTSVVNLEYQRNLSIITDSPPFGYTLSTRIFHPPK